MTIQKKAVKPQKKSDNAGETAREPLYIVAIGASAGGLETLKTFFLQTRLHPNIAFVIITHLHPSTTSMLPELLQQYTPLSVVPIEDNQVVKPNYVYVLPPGSNAEINNTRLHLIKRQESEFKLPINLFLNSLAIDQREKAVCIILSGTGTDGTSGLRSLRERGGLIIVQTAASARFDGMPKSAINTGLVDYILPPEKMYSFLVKYLASKNNNALEVEINVHQEVQQILNLLRIHTSHDFSLYKPNTIFRRIHRRLNVLQIDTISAYIEYIHQYPQETEILFKELLINVTSFFPDAEAFDILKSELLATLKN